MNSGYDHEVISRQAKWRRAVHKQLLEEAALDGAPPDFKGTQFIAFMLSGGKGITFDRTGSIVVSFAAPAEMAEHVMKLRAAMMMGAPLSIDIQLWEPYIDAVNAPDA